MAIRLFTRSKVTPLVAVQWYIDTLKEEISLVEPRSRRIPEFPKEKVARAKRDIVDRCLRQQYYFGWAKGSIYSSLGVVYREALLQPIVENYIKEQNSENRKCLETLNTTVEQVIPVALLRDILLTNGLKKKDIVKALLSPVALITKESENRLRKMRKSNNSEFPFQRYAPCGIQIGTHTNIKVSESWSMADHWNLLKNTPAFNEILKCYGIEVK